MVAYRSEVDDELGDLEENLQRLTVGIPDVTTDDLPRHYQCHTDGVSRRFLYAITSSVKRMTSL